jgi:hypothetical protein
MGQIVSDYPVIISPFSRLNYIYSGGEKQNYLTFHTNFEKDLSVGESNDST